MESLVSCALAIVTSFLCFIWALDDDYPVVSIFMLFLSLLGVVCAWNTLIAS